MHTTSGKKQKAKGSCGIEVFQGRLRLRLPRHIYEGKQKYLTLGLDDTPGNRTIAEAKAKQIESDIAFERFDFTLNKYRPETFKLVATESKAASASLQEIWDKYMEFLTPQSSPSTMRYQWRVFTNYLRKLPTHDLEKATEIRDWVIANIPPDSAKRFITRLNAACNWAISSGMLTTSPFAGMANQIKVPKAQKNNEDGDINPFSAEEREQILEAFRTNKYCSKYSRVKHSYYANYVEFLFMTGCRPSEAIALERKDISSDLRTITFDCAVVLGNNGLVKKSGLKTQERRKFPINAKLKVLIEKVIEGKSDTDLLFPSPEKNEWIDTHNFRNRVWKPVLDGLGIEYRKPYQTRHTFITLALENGLDAKDVGRLVGNSPEVIYKHYAGNKRELFVPEF